MANAQHVPRRDQAWTESASFYTLFTVSFVLFGAMALAGALFGSPWRSWLPGAEGVKSSIGAVKAAVYTFMSQIY